LYIQRIDVLGAWFKRRLYMVYRVFNTKQEQLAEIYANWPLLRVDDDLPIVVNGKETLYKVIKVGKFNVSADNKLVLDIWVQ
jgi:hypothetical protein